MTDSDPLRGDCSRCIGLCCVALSFERGPLFAFDKLANESCRHLISQHRCEIHHRLAQEGMSGCSRYDCLGAGQLATALFADLDWRRSSAVRRHLFRAFSVLREIQVMRGVYRRLGLPAGALEPTTGWTLAALLLDAPGALSTARAGLATLVAQRRKAS